jgi:hypothetical protein
MLLNKLPDLIDKLTAETRKDTFPFEREILLLQFQTWIYCPTIYTPRNYDIAEQSAIIIATKLLRRLEKRDEIKRYSTAEWLTREKYKLLFESVIDRYGGWTRLEQINPIEIESILAARREQVKTVCAIMDWRFRYLEHDGSDKHLANLTHGKFFFWKQRQIAKTPITGKTINNHWSANKPSAVFVYVSEKFESFFPPRFVGPALINDMRKRTSALERTQRFFGLAAYVAHKLDPSSKDWSMKFLDPKWRPETQPITNEERDIMSHYKDEVVNMTSN